MFLSYVGEWAPGGADRDPADRQLRKGRSRYKALHHHTVFRVLEFSRLLQGFEGFLRDIVRPDGVLEGFERLVKFDGVGVRLCRHAILPGINYQDLELIAIFPASAVLMVAGVLR